MPHKDEEAVEGQEVTSLQQRSIDSFPLAPDTNTAQSPIINISLNGKNGFMDKDEQP